MTAEKVLVLDANILIRAVLGRRVRELVRKYADTVCFCAPDVCFADARKYITDLGQRKGLTLNQVFAFMEEVESVVQAVDKTFYQTYELHARRRIDRRDSDDWPVLAVAMQFRCPVWTEDQDFFGSGIATWTTDLVELYLEESS